MEDIEKSKDKDKDKDKDKEESSSIEDLKNEYKKFFEKYTLPEFSKINESFDIEDTEVETEFFLRKIRKIVSEKIAGYMRFIEILLNPSNAPLFFFNLIKKMNDEDRGILTEIYETLGNLEIEVVKLDLDYNEENEAKFINDVYNNFDKIKVKLLKLMNKLSNGEGYKNNIEKSYFG